MIDQRHRIARRIETDPGIHFNALVEDLGLASGQVQYHVRRLLKDGTVLRHHQYGRTHYYPPEYDSWERRVIALLRRETARDILVYLLSHGPSAPGTVADDLGIARSTLEWQLERLIEQDLVHKNRDGGNRVTLVLVNPTKAVELLGEIEPSLPDRLVDRFTRLLDSFFAEGDQR